MSKDNFNGFSQLNLLRPCLGANLLVEFWVFGSCSRNFLTCILSCRALQWFATNTRAWCALFWSLSFAVQSDAVFSQRYALLYLTEHEVLRISIWFTWLTKVIHYLNLSIWCRDRSCSQMNVKCFNYLEKQICIGMEISAHCQQCNGYMELVRWFRPGAPYLLAEKVRLLGL